MKNVVVCNFLGSSVHYYGQTIRSVGEQTPETKMEILQIRRYALAANGQLFIYWKFPMLGQTGPSGFLTFVWRDAGTLHAGETIRFSKRILSTSHVSSWDKGQRVRRKSERMGHYSERATIDFRFVCTSRISISFPDSSCFEIPGEWTQNACVQYFRSHWVKKKTHKRSDGDWSKSRVWFRIGERSHGVKGFDMVVSPGPYPGAVGLTIVDVGQDLKPFHVMFLEGEGHIKRNRGEGKNL